MSITIETAQLARVMKHAAAVVESRNTIPITRNVLLRAEGDTLEIATSNLDVEFRQTLPLVEGGSLATTVDARRLSALAQAAGNGSQLKLEMDDNQLSVRNGRSRWKMPVLPEEDFPTIPFEDATATLEMAGAELASALGRVMWSVSDEPTRYYLNGPLLHGEAGKTALAATNGHSLVRSQLATEHPEAPEVILMPKFCRLVESIAAEAKLVSLEWGTNKIRASIGDIVLTAKVIDGTFPDYRRIIPPTSDAELIVEPEAIIGAVRKVQVLASDKTRCVKVERGEDKLTLSVTSPDSGTGSSEQPAQCAEGFVTGFNAKYLESMLASIGGDSVRIDQADAGAPARFQRVVEDGALGVIMPMRV